MRSQGAIMAEFVSYIGPFLSAFYALERDRVNLVVLSASAHERLDGLLEIERARGIQRLYNHLFKASNIINEILTRILEIEIEKSRSNRFFLERRRATAFGENALQIYRTGEQNTKYFRQRRSGKSSRGRRATAEIDEESGCSCCRCAKAGS
jgi:hypothetical protein